MNWVKKHKLLAIKVIQYNSCPCLELSDLWQALYLLFNLIQDHQVNPELLEEIPSKLVMK